MYAKDVEDETRLGFGKIMALFLLIQPLLQLVDSISGTYLSNVISVRSFPVPSVVYHHRLSSWTSFSLGMGFNRIKIS